MKYSPGPWVPTPDECDGSVISIYAGDPCEDNTRILADVFIAHISVKEAEANAVLIAASPVMLQSLREIVSWAKANDMPANHPIFEITLPAINKATIITN